jgi:hypothetical protein
MNIPTQQQQHAKSMSFRLPTLSTMAVPVRAAAKVRTDQHAIHTRDTWHVALTSDERSHTVDKVQGENLVLVLDTGLGEEDRQEV